MFGRHTQASRMNPRSQEELKCFNCERPSCHVTSCPFPRNRAKIERNLDTWRASQGVMRTSSRIHAVDISHLDLDPGIKRNILYAS